MDTRATTPPVVSETTQLTPELQRKIQENRLKAKARYQASIQSHSVASSNTPNAFNKRPALCNDQNQPTASASFTSSSLPNHHPVNNHSHDANSLPNMIGKFVDYDLSTLKNSKGGFLVNEDESDERILRERRQMAELKKKRDLQAQKLQEDPHLSIVPGSNPQCVVCGTVELDFQLFKIFKVAVCPKCRNNHPERFSLLTKTECKEDYLLTDPELKDVELLPHLLRPNPHRSTYSNMMLFLREQVEKFAFSDKKWGSAEALDAEFEKRQADKKKKKNKKFDDKLKELRKRTRSNVWHQRQEAEHVHVFELHNKKQSRNSRSKNAIVEVEQVQKCTGCGLEVECEQF